MVNIKIDVENKRSKEDQYVVFTINQHMFALGVSILEDVIINQEVTRIPLAPSYVKGCINLRGRVVTILDANQLLGIEDSLKPDQIIVVLEYDDHLYGFRVDQVIKIMELANSSIIANPGNISEMWQRVSKGIFKYDSKLVLVIDNAKFVSSFVEG